MDFAKKGGVYFTSLFFTPHLFVATTVSVTCRHISQWVRRYREEEIEG